MLPLHKVGSSSGAGLMKGAGIKRLPPLTKAHEPQLVWMALVFFPGISAMLAQTTAMESVNLFFSTHKIPDGTTPPSHHQYFVWAAANGLAGGDPPCMRPVSLLIPSCCIKAVHLHPSSSRPRLLNSKTLDPKP
jgi:hypothetical protein